MVYLTATLMAAFAPPTDMEAIQILPDRSWSATVRNLEGVISHIKEIRSCQSSTIGGELEMTAKYIIRKKILANLALPLPISEVNSPSSVTSLYLQ